MKKNVLIFGAGRRARATVLPAFWSLREEYNIFGVVTKTVRDISLFSGKFITRTRNDLEGIDFKKIDLIVLAVPIDQVRGILASLTKFNTKDIYLILDTPVISLKHLGSLKYSKLYKGVVVAEDFISLPNVIQYKKIIESGNIGKLKHLHLFHSGFKHHALSMIKTVTGSRNFTYIISTKYFGETRIKKIRSGNGVKTTMIEPRDYDVAKNLLIGDKGMIADYPINASSVIVLDYLYKDKRHNGISIDGLPIPPTATDEYFYSNIAEFTDEVSFINDLKIRGYMEIVRSLSNRSTAFIYSPIEGVYDNLAIKISDKLGFFFDFGFGRFSVFKSFIYLLIKILPK